MARLDEAKTRSSLYRRIDMLDEKLAALLTAIKDNFNDNVTYQVHNFPPNVMCQLQSFKEYACVAGSPLPGQDEVGQGGDAVLAERGEETTAAVLASCILPATCSNLIWHSGSAGLALSLWLCKISIIVALYI